MRTISIVLLLMAVAAVSLTAGVLESRPVGPGIVHYHDNRAAWHVHVLEIDLTDTLVHLETVKAEDNLYGYERTSGMAARTDAEEHRVVGAINADFYNAGGIPVGAQIVGGELVKAPYVTRSVFAVSDEKAPFLATVALQGTAITADSAVSIANVNAARTDSTLILYNRFMGATTGTNEWGTEVIAQYLTAPIVNDTVWLVVADIDSGMAVGHGNNAIPAAGVVLSGNGDAATFLKEQVAVGDTIAYLLEMPPLTDPLVEMVGGLPRLIRDSVATVEYEEESASLAFTTDRHPRTAVGINGDSTKVYFFTVDGRQPNYSMGMSLYELADYMLSWGVKQGVNLDGGGSTTMVVRGTVVNSPSDPGGERWVANALLAISTAPTGPLTALEIAPDSAYIIINSKAGFGVNGFDQYWNSVVIEADSIRWSCTAAIGTIDSSGQFTAGAEEGIGYIYARVGDITDSAKVYITDIREIRLLPNPIILQIDQEQLVVAESRDAYDNIITLQPTDYEWWATDSIGTVSTDGTFLATQAGLGYIYAGYHAVVGSTAVSIGAGAEVILDKFVTTGNWSLSFIGAVSSACTLYIDNGLYVSPRGSMMLEYELMATGETSAVYMDCSLPVSGTPDAIGLWVYGDGKGHWLRGEFVDADNEKFLVDFTDQIPGIDWSDAWHYLQVPFTEAFPSWSNTAATLNFPITWKRIYLVEIDDTKKDAGAIRIDDLAALYIELGTTEDGDAAIPETYSLEQNYPNPFNPVTMVRFGLPEGTPVKVVIYDLRGREVNRLADQWLEPGRHALAWAGRDQKGQDLPSGIYIARLTTPTFIQSIKMVLLK
ncbi:phosphodiester glycosidase family protein [Candidatus Neomarinimicrobiota bacterium]